MSFSISYTYQIKDLYSKPLASIAQSTDRLRKAMHRINNKTLTFASNTSTINMRLGSLNTKTNTTTTSINRYATSVNRATEANDRFAKSSLGPGLPIAPRGGGGHRRTAGGGHRRTVGGGRGRSDPGIFSGIIGIVSGFSAIRQASSFQLAMNKVKAFTFASNEEMKRMKATAKDLGKTTQFTASQVAEGMVQLSLQGLKTANIIETIPKALKFAAAGGIEIFEAVLISTDILNQMGLKIKDLGGVIDKLIMTQISSKTNIKQISEAARNTATVASDAGLSLSLLLSLIGKMAAAGEKGGRAGTRFKAAILKFFDPSKKALKMMRKLKIDVKEFITEDDKFINIVSLFGRLKKAGATNTQLKEFFTARGLLAIKATMRSTKKEIDSLTKSIEKSAGASNIIGKIIMEGLPGALKRVISAIESLNLEVFDSGGLGQFLVNIFDSITQLFRKLSKSNPTLLKFIGGLGLIATIGVPALVMLGLLSSGMAALFSITSLLFMGFTLVSGSIFLMSGKNKAIGDSFKNVLKELKPVVTSFKNFFKLLEGNEMDGVTTKVNSLTSAINGLAAVMHFVMGPFRLLSDMLEFMNEDVGGKKGIVNIHDFLNQSSPEQLIGRALWDLIPDIPTISKLTQKGIESFGDFLNGNNQSINGKINIEVTGPGKVKNSEINTSFPGNLGFAEFQSNPIWQSL